MSDSALKDVAELIADFENPEHLIDLESFQRRAIGLRQYVGTLANNMEADYAHHYAECLDRLLSMDKETETTRKAKLNDWTREKKAALKNLKVMSETLRSIVMATTQMVKTRREEMGMR